MPRSFLLVGKPMNAVATGIFAGVAEASACAAAAPIAGYCMAGIGDGRERGRVGELVLPRS